MLQYGVTVCDVSAVLQYGGSLYVTSALCCSMGVTACDVSAVLQYGGHYVTSVLCCSMGVTVCDVSAVLQCHLSLNGLGSTGSGLYQTMCVCVCVCVCKRERERERGVAYKCVMKHVHSCMDARACLCEYVNTQAADA